jgi:protein gp37
MADTSIEWTDTTWNPTTGCDKISAGCDNCYALTMARRLKAMGQAKYQTDGDPRTSGPGFGLAVHPDTLGEPFKWRKPRKVFVNSMSDLFHAKVPMEFVRRVFEVIEATPQHTYQVLTKRAARLPKVADKLPWPSNLWLGVSAEDQEQANLRIPALLATPAKVKFISAEPLLGPVVLRDDWIGLDPYSRDKASLNWVIVGGESGPNARPMAPDWARHLRDQCVSAGVPYFFKQWGSWAPSGWNGIGRPLPGSVFVGDEIDVAGHRVEMARVAKKSEMRELDGRTWDQFPNTMPQEVSVHG